MTDRQQERFLVLSDSDERARFVEDLHIPDRLAKFPVYIRDAILAQKIVPGMSKEAVLLSWGKPREIDRRDVDGIPSACWMYERVGPDRQLSERKVYFLNELVTEVTP